MTCHPSPLERSAVQQKQALQGANVDMGEPAEGVVSAEAQQEPADATPAEISDTTDPVYRRVWERANETALKRLGEFEAADVAQDVAMIFMDRWRAGELDRSDDKLVDTWATRAGRYLSLKAIRKRDRREEHEFMLDIDPLDEGDGADEGGERTEADEFDRLSRAHVESPSQLYDARELAEVMRRTWVGTPHRLRQVFRAIRLDGEKPEEIAKRLHLKLETVRWHYKMACARLHAAAHNYLTEGLLPEAK